MRPRPDKLFFLSLSLAEVVDPTCYKLVIRTDNTQAAVFNRVKRDGFLKEARQVFEEGAVAGTVTETVRQTITVNGAGAIGPPNATITQTVTVSVNVGAGPEAPAEGPAEGTVGDEAFEGYVLLSKCVGQD